MTLEILRYMAWERAKGELNSMLHTYVNDQEKYWELGKAIEDFVMDVESHGKHE